MVPILSSTFFSLINWYNQLKVLTFERTPLQVIGGILGQLGPKVIAIVIMFMVQNIILVFIITFFLLWCSK